MPKKAVRAKLALATILAASAVGCQTTARTDFTGRVVPVPTPRDPDTRDLDDALRVVSAVGFVAGVVAAWVTGCGSGLFSGYGPAPYVDRCAPGNFDAYTLKSRY